MPFFSVVIPTYNRSGTIDYCLRSVITQSFTDFEVIIVDDCSHDDTVALIEKYGDERIRCIVLDINSGAQAARNRGIREAKGEWIAFQDSDDEWLSGKLQQQYEVLKIHYFNPYIVLYTNCFTYVPATGEKKTWSLNNIGSSQSEAYKNLLTSEGPMFQGLVASKEALINMGCLDECVPSYQEWDTAISLAKRCVFVHMEQPLFKYYLHDSDNISKNKIKEIEGYQYIIEKYEEEIKRICEPEVWENHLYIQLIKSIQFKLWGHAHFYLGMLKEKRRPDWYKYRLSVLLHIQPEKFRWFHPIYFVKHGASYTRRLFYRFTNNSNHG